MSDHNPENTDDACLRDCFDRVVGGPLMGMDSQTVEFVVSGLAEALADPAFGLSYRDGLHDRRMAFASVATPVGLFYFFVPDNLDARIVLEKQPERIRSFVDDLKNMEQQRKLSGLQPAQPTGH